jgi:hypothetical protein
VLNDGIGSTALRIRLTLPLDGCDAGEPSSWLDNANFALYAPKNNASATESTFIFGINNAPVVSEGGSVWSMDVTMIPSNTDSIYAATSVSSFSAQVILTGQKMHCSLLMFESRRQRPILLHRHVPF